MLARLLREWNERLFRLRRIALDPAGGQPWLCAIRIRILNFLIARYADPVAAPMAPAEPRDPQDPPTAGPIVPFCLVDDPTGPPPRAAPVIAGLLGDIRRCNLARRTRWRFWP